MEFVEGVTEKGKLKKYRELFSFVNTVTILITIPPPPPPRGGAYLNQSSQMLFFLDIILTLIYNHCLPLALIWILGLPRAWSVRVTIVRVAHLLVSVFRFNWTTGKNKQTNKTRSAFTLNACEYIVLQRYVIFVPATLKNISSSPPRERESGDPGCVSQMKIRPREGSFPCESLSRFATPKQCFRLAVRSLRKTHSTAWLCFQ